MLSNVIDFKQFPEDVEAIIHASTQSSNSLNQALSRLANGTPDTPRSWFYEDIKDPQEILGILTAKLKDMKDLKSIAEWDLSKSDKFRPQGGTAPLKDRIPVLEEYFTHLDSPEIVKDPMWTRAKNTAIKRLGFNKSGSPVSAESVVNRGISEDKYNTNSGYPLFLKRKSEEARHHTLEHYQDAIRDRYPYVLGSRATMGKTGDSARFIFMAPMAVNVEGQRFQQPLQDYLRSKDEDFFTPWEGWDQVQQKISKYWPENLKFGADYSKMDQHFNIHHGREVYEVVKQYFKPQHWEELWEAIQYPFTCPIITSEGMIDQTHALASGSEWTNFLETVWNYVFTIYLELKYHLVFVSKLGIGDDQLWFLKLSGGQKAITWITGVVVKEMSYAGTPGNAEKQEVSYTETGFLQRHCESDWPGNDGSIPAAGVYSLIRNATSQVFPEKYHNEEEWDADMFSQRAVMIGENCVNHPEFKWYVQEFMAKANKHILEYARKSDEEIDAIQERSKNIANFVPTYNQEKQGQKLKDFAVLKLLREIA